MQMPFDQLPHCIPILNKEVDMIVQAYLQYIYTTFGRSLTMITENGKESKNDLFKKVADELGIKHNFSSTYHPPSKGILEKFHSFLKTCIKNTFMVNLIGKIQCSFPSLVSGCFELSILKKALSSSFLAEIL